MVPTGIVFVFSYKKFMRNDKKYNKSSEPPKKAIPRWSGRAFWVLAGKLKARIWHNLVTYNKSNIIDGCSFVMDHGWLSAVADGFAVRRCLI